MRSRPTATGPSEEGGGMTEEYDRYRYEQARAWLEHVRRLGIEADRIQGLVEAERASLDGVRGIDYTRERVSGTPMPPDIADLVDSLFEHIREYTASLSAYTDERMKAARALDGLEDARERQVLTGYYLMGRTWDEVRANLGYSWQGIMTLRRRAIVSAYSVVPVEWRDPQHPAL